MKYEKDGVKVQYFQGKNGTQLVHEFVPPMDKDGRILWTEIRDSKDDHNNFPNVNTVVVIRPEWQKKHLKRHMDSWGRRGRRRKK